MRLKHQKPGRVFMYRYEHVDYAGPGLMNTDDSMAPCTESDAKRAFRRAGWEGDGELRLIWLPPFLFVNGDSYGIMLWHVKQQNNGTSFLCSDAELEFPGVSEPNKLVLL